MTSDGEIETVEDLGSTVDVDPGVEIDEENAEDDLLGGLQIDSTADIEVPDRLVDQVIGQDEARDIIIKAAKQRRHVMMIGSPEQEIDAGQGDESAVAPGGPPGRPGLSQPDDGNEPKVRTVPAGKGEQIIDAHKEEARKRNQMRSILMWIIIAIIIGYAILAMNILLGILAAGIVWLIFRYTSRGTDAMVPNMIVDNGDQRTALRGRHRRSRRCTAGRRPPRPVPVRRHGDAQPRPRRAGIDPQVEQGRAVRRRDQHPRRPDPTEADDGDPGRRVLHHRPVRTLLGRDGPDRTRPL